MELVWTVQMARHYFAKPEPGGGWRDVPNGRIARVLTDEIDRLIARVEELEAAIQTYCEGKCPYKNFFTEEPLCEDGSGADWCPLYPFRGGE